MYELSTINAMDIFVMSLLFCISLNMSCLIHIKKGYYIILMLSIVFLIFCTPTLTQAGTFLTIFMEVLIIMYFSNGMIKAQLTNILFAYLILIITLAFSEITVGLVLFEYLEFNENDILNKIIYNIIYMTVFILLNFTCNIIIKKIYKSRNNIDKSISTKDYMLMINLVLLLVLFSFILLLYHYSGNRQIFATIVLMICLVMGINQFLYQYFYNNKIEMAIKNTKLSLYIDNLVQYNAKLEKDAKDIMEFKHDTKNMHFTLNELIMKNKDEELKKFYFEKIFPISNNALQKEKIYTKLENIKNIQLKSLLYCKLLEASEKDIDLMISIKGHLDTIIMDVMDLIIVIGIYLDNAIEECMNIKKSYIRVEILKNEEGEEYIIENSVSRRVKIENLKKGYSTKGVNHGNGLRIAETIIDKYDFVIKNTESTDDFFKQIITIYEPN